MSIAMDTAESIAKYTIERFVENARMKFREQQHAGEYDFDLYIQERPTAVVEATASMDKGLRETIAAIEDSDKGGQLIPASLCRNGWIVYPKADAKIKRIRRDVDAYLAKIEDEGLQSFFFDTDAHEYSSVYQIFEHLRIEGGTCGSREESRQICVTRPGSGGKVSASKVQDAVLHEAYKFDNIRKLEIFERLQRNLFVYLDFEYFLAHVSLIDCNPPTELVILPDKITHVWVATFTKNPGELIAWKAQNGSQWINMGTFPDHRDI